MQTKSHLCLIVEYDFFFVKLMTKIMYILKIIDLYRRCKLKATNASSWNRLWMLWVPLTRLGRLQWRDLTTAMTSCMAITMTSFR